MAQDDGRARVRDERERETIMAMAMIAPTPELIRQVIALGVDRADAAPPGHRTVVIEVVSDRARVDDQTLTPWR